MLHSCKKSTSSSIGLPIRMSFGMYTRLSSHSSSTSVMWLCHPLTGNGVPVESVNCVFSYRRVLVQQHETPVFLPDSASQAEDLFGLQAQYLASKRNISPSILQDRLAQMTLSSSSNLLASASVIISRSAPINCSPNFAAQTNPSPARTADDKKPQGSYTIRSLSSSDRFCASHL